MSNDMERCMEKAKPAAGQAERYRLAMNVDVVVDGYQVPMSVSIAGAIIAALLALLVWREARN